jgi:hypothetical protein
MTTTTNSSLAEDHEDTMRYLLGPIVTLVLLMPVASAQGQEAKKAIDFQRDIQPVLAENCFRCHSATKMKGGLRVDSLRSILEGGYSGPAIVLGKGKDSLIIKKTDENDPTPHKGVVLTAQQLTLIKTWIDQAAPATAAASGKKPTIVEVDLSKLPPDLAKEIREALAKPPARGSDKKP